MLNSVEYIYSNPNGKLNNENNLIPFINYHTPAPQRCLDMLLAKYHGRPYQTEVVMPAVRKNVIPKLRCKLKDATILLITDGGLVPKNNPDQIPSTCSKKYGIYSIEGEDSLSSAKYEVSHQGYDNSYVEENPNRLLPLDVLREFERMNVIGHVFNQFITTTGVMLSTEHSIRLGKRIARYVSAQPVDAVLIVSACGTSTRCGAYIGKAIEDVGIPVVQITNLARIAADNGISRVVKGNDICHPFGDPSLTFEAEFDYRRQLAFKALDLLSNEKH